MQKYDLFEGMDAELKKAVRKAMIEVILQTDMALHFDLIEKVKTRLLQGPLEKEKEKDRQLLANLILHACDISNPARVYFFHHQI